MIRIIHKRLTLLFSCIAIAILTVLSLCCLHISEANLKENSFLSFRSDVNTLLSTLEHQTVITHELLSKMEGTGNYIISIRDNGKEFLWGRNKELTDSAWRHYYDSLDTVSLYPQSAGVSTVFSTFESFPGYYGCAAFSTRPGGTLSVLILKPLVNLEQRVQEQRILFSIVIVTGSTLLFFFSGYFIGQLLRPIEENRQKQISFVACASHELRTPLSVILSAADACQRIDSTGQKPFFSIIKKEGETMSRLISDLLFLAETERQDAAILLADKNPCEPDTLLLSIYEAYETMARQKGYFLHIHLPESPSHPVRCDENRIRQVFSILIQNAFSHTPVGTKITLQLEQDSRNTVFGVIDNGPGIPDDQKVRIFERFFRGDTSHQSNGHFGLGLSIASEIIQAHGGNMYIRDTAFLKNENNGSKNQSAGGAAFFFSLPL